ncbi:RTC4-like domain-containing protein [Triangularia verruculosa]|uniref:Restriction of telomere capping protein 4 n=1 Tax=Triangularia verruculosa TaxID=2587418 RepID=A0AAN6XL69_9PEZI|nr:RTC4-like domain-containing protein [Triangularia verruculosa]
MVTNIKVMAPWKPRRTGLNRNEKVDPLLKTLNGRPISPASQELTDKRLPDGISTPGPNDDRDSMGLPDHLPSPSRGSHTLAPRQDSGVFPSSPGSFELPDPVPQKTESKSSQDSTRVKRLTRQATESIDSTDSEDEVSQRGQIMSTTFGPSKKAESTTVSISSDSKKDAGGPRRHAMTHTSGSGLDAARKPKVDAEEVGKTATEDIFRQTFKNNKKKFGKKKGRDEEPRGQRKRGGPSTGGREPKKQRSSQEEKKDPADSLDEKETTPRRDALPPPLPPPENDSSPARPKSSIPLRLDSSPMKPRVGLPKRVSTLDETPGSATQIELLKMPDLLDDPFRTAVDWTATPTAATSKTKKQANDDTDFGRPYSPTKFTSSPVTPLSEPPLSPIHLPALFKPAICPLCKEEVDPDLLSAFQDANPRPTVQAMQMFCLRHKKHSARELWEEKGYPDIKWRELDQRIADLYPFIRSILQGKRKSYYADQFRDKIKGGQNKTLLSSDENLTPGYYGIRGLRQMSENLIQEFSSVLRRRALEDNLISARGHTAYLQGVLVPELATRLVMEDMLVEEHEARTILKESSWVGELMNDEVADVVFESDSEDDSDGGR